MLGRSLFPSMIRRGYDTRLSVGTILGGASLDPIIPPSVLAIIVATLAQISTGKLLVAGIHAGIAADRNVPGLRIDCGVGQARASLRTSPPIWPTAIRAAARSWRFCACCPARSSSSWSWGSFFSGSRPRRKPPPPECSARSCSRSITVSSPGTCSTESFTPPSSSPRCCFSSCAAPSCSASS